MYDTIDVINIDIINNQILLIYLKFIILCVFLSGLDFLSTVFNEGGDEWLTCGTDTYLDSTPKSIASQLWKCPQLRKKWHENMIKKHHDHILFKSDGPSICV